MPAGEKTLRGYRGGALADLSRLEWMSSDSDSKHGGIWHERYRIQPACLPMNGSWSQPGGCAQPAAGLLGRQPGWAVQSSGIEVLNSCAAESRPARFPGGLGGTVQSLPDEPAGACAMKFLAHAADGLRAAGGDQAFCVPARP